MHDVDGLNAGYASALLEQYLENPEAVPSEWRALFESGASELVATHPGPRAVGRAPAGGRERPRRDGACAVAAAAARRGRALPPPPPSPAAPPPDKTLLGAVAAAMALVKAYRTHGHLAARLDPLGSEPVGDPSLEPERLEPKLTPELQQLIPADILRVHVPGETLADVLPRLRETYCGTSAYEIEHISDHEQRVWLRSAIESGRYRQPLDAGREAPPARAPDRGRGLRALPPPRVPRPEAVLDRGARRDDPDARRGDRARRRGRRARGRARHGASRPAQRPRARARPARTRRSCGSSRASGRSRRSPPTQKAAPATSSTTSAPRARDRRLPATSRSRWPRTRATSKRSTPSSRDARAPSRPTARAAPATTTRRSRCRSRSTATRPSRRRASSRRR